MTIDTESAEIVTESAKHVPNSIGRLDPIVNAIRFGNYSEAEKLLEAESERVAHQYEQAVEASMRLGVKFREIEFFRGRVHVSHEFRQLCTMEVGG